MPRPITAFVPQTDSETLGLVLDEIARGGLVERVYVLCPSTGEPKAIKVPIYAELVGRVEAIAVPSLLSSKTVQAMAERAGTGHALMMLTTPIAFGQFGLERMLDVASSTGAGLVYSDYYDLKDGKKTPHPTIDYQVGSLRDDFNFGSVLLMDSGGLKKAAKEIGADHAHAGVYALRLALSRSAPVVRVGEFLYSKIEADTRKTGEKQFDYVDPKNRAVQIEMEAAATAHLKKIGAFLGRQFSTVDLEEGKCEVEASVVIPVRNRVKTVSDAVESILKQKTNFPFNLIIVDNHSTDGTSDVVKAAASRDPRVVHVVPERNDLGIGGCWTEAIHHAKCGRFAVQLDSDDLYSDEHTLQKVVDVFRREKCAMVIGSYQMVNFKLEEIPPGVIDHKEWTPENGRNNALRINGLGAPRAFYTPVLRKINVPNVSYGEDYAVGLVISRDYQIGRIYEPIYLCRRWEGNSDADLDVGKANAYNWYKDKIRTIEILARQKKNSSTDGHR